MKKFAVCIVLCLFCVTAQAQEFVVKSFESKITDLTAKLDPVRDLNGEPCALIRVALACKGCRFEGNIIGAPKVNPGEYLVYVPAGTRRLKISHPDYLPLTYEFNLQIEKNCTYELRITLPQNYTAIPELNSQFLVLTVAPQNAIVFIDDILQATSDGILSKELAYGAHTYRIESPMYHPRRGTFTISESGKTTLSVSLDPAYGFLSISSVPERDARVFVDGKEVGKTPYKSDRMPSGSYQVQVLKEGYYPQMQPVTVADNQTLPLQFTLKPSFAEITLQSANSQAEIWVSGKKYGEGRWSGRLGAGTYSVESRCEGYEKVLQSITVEAGKPQTIRLQAQTPIYGVLKINSTPIGASVVLDGKLIGETPLISNQVLVGSHQVEILKAGFVTTKRSILITKAQPANIAVQLGSVYGTVAVQSTPAKAMVTIDERYVGTTPLTSDNLSEGEHTVEIKLTDYNTQTKKIQIQKNTQAKLSVMLQRFDAMLVYQKAKAALKTFDTNTARTLLLQAAEAGNADAQYELGKLYMRDRVGDKVKIYNMLLLSGRLAEFATIFPYDETSYFKYQSGTEEIVKEITEPMPGYNNPASKWYKKVRVIESRKTGQYKPVYSTYYNARKVRLGKYWGILFSNAKTFIPCVFSEWELTCTESGPKLRGGSYNNEPLTITVEGYTGKISSTGIWLEKKQLPPANTSAPASTAAKTTATAASTATGDYIHIPDPNFLAYVIKNFDTNKNFQISKTEAAAVTKIDIGYKSIASLIGIEHFVNLKQLTCTSNELTTLDVGRNTQLTSLDCRSNELTTLDVSRNTQLTSLDCWGNKLTTLDVSRNTQLTSLDCSFNELTTLDVGRNTQLTSLDCVGNELTTLDVSRNTQLTSLKCGGNELTTLDLSKNSNLTKFNLENNSNLQVVYVWRGFKKSNSEFKADKSVKFTVKK